MAEAKLDIETARKQLPRLKDRVRKEGFVWVTRGRKKAFAIVAREWIVGVGIRKEGDKKDAYRVLSKRLKLEWTTL